MSLVWQLKERQLGRVDEGFGICCTFHNILLGTAIIIAVRLRDTSLSHSVLASQSRLETSGCVPIANNQNQRPKEPIGSF